MKIGFILLPMMYALAACGGGGGGETPMAKIPPANFVQLPSAPAAGSAGAVGPNFDINDEVGYSFDLYSGQINTSTTGVSGPTRAETILTRAVLNADSVSEVTLKAPSGNVFVFELDSIDTNTNPNFDEYFYITEDKSFSMRIKRFPNGGNQAILKAGDFNASSPLRASFAYGWKTDLASVIPDPGTTTANFRGFGSSDFYLSSGQRAFGGASNFVVDFSAMTVNGTLFDTLGGPPQGGSKTGVGITAKVDVTNATLNADGTISGTDGVDVTFTDTVNPVISIAGTSSEILGQLSGVDAASLGGGFAGTMDVSQTGLSGNQALGYSGVFRATRQ